MLLHRAVDRLVSSDQAFARRTAKCTCWKPLRKWQGPRRAKAKLVRTLPQSRRARSSRRHQSIRVRHNESQIVVEVLGDRYFHDVHANHQAHRAPLGGRYTWECYCASPFAATVPGTLRLELDSSIRGLAMHRRHSFSRSRINCLPVIRGSGESPKPCRANPMRPAIHRPQIPDGLPFAAWEPNRQRTHGVARGA